MDGVHGGGKSHRSSNNEFLKTAFCSIIIRMLASAFGDNRGDRHNLRSWLSRVLLKGVDANINQSGDRGSGLGDFF